MHRIFYVRFDIINSFFHWDGGMRVVSRRGIGFVSQTVYDEYMRLPVDIRAKTERIVGLIESYGLENVGMPYVRHIRGKLWELRAKGKNTTGRSLYVVQDSEWILILRCFEKKTEKTPKREIDLAMKRFREREVD